MTSVMPQGVEHPGGPLNPMDTLDVMTSVMPQGVEHFGMTRPNPPARYVMTSVMPQGVEHIGQIIHGSTRTTGDDLRDAARR